MSAPYRSRALRDQESPRVRDAFASPLVAPLFIFWIISVTRVIGGFLNREAFGAETALALVAMIALPYLLADSVMQLARNWRRRIR